MNFQWLKRAFEHCTDQCLCSRITIFVVVILTCFNAHSSTSLCEHLLAALSEQGKPVRPGKARVEFIIKLIGEFEKTNDAKTEEDAVGYMSIVRKLEYPNQTIHTEDPARNYPDARVILTLPKPGEATVWGLLNPHEREWLALQLEHILRVGTYDNELVGASPGHTKLWYALQSLVDYKSPYASGISPREVLRRSARGCIAGVCRQSAAVLAGLLGELGIPPEQIRLVSGRENPQVQSRHIWVEIQLVRGATQWMILDPTPRGQHSGAEIRGGSSQSNHYIFSYDRKVYPNFLIPINLPQNP